ncbi:MAG: DUF805 domain-containing protein [Rhodospirillales bacterium]|nr:MAG: DUF805 domain-containing protein [Rhodospirillales bacterium]
MAEVTTPVQAAPEMTLMKVWFSFEGRISRATWWMKYALPYLGISFAVSILDMILGTHFVVVEASAANGYMDQTMGILSLIWTFPGLWMSIAAGAKRCHDRNRSGWFQLLWLVPLVNLWVLVEIWFLRGTVGPNRFGTDPVTE